MTTDGFRKFCSLIYRDASVFLERKYERYQELLKIMDDIVAKKSSKYKGVYFNRANQCWFSSFWDKKKTIYLGSFKTEEEAHDKLISYVSLRTKTSPDTPPA